MTRRAIITASAPKPNGTYSQAIVASGELVFISGQTARLLDGTRLQNVPFAEQARKVLENLNAVAGAAGLSLKDAVKVTVYLRDPTDNVEFDRVYAEFVAAPPPARTLVQSGFVGFDVEVDAILAAPVTRER